MKSYLRKLFINACHGIRLRTLGVSLSDTTKTIASSYTTIRFPENEYETLFPQLKQLVEQYDIDLIVLGFPKNMNNTVGDRGNTTIDFQQQLQEYLNIQVILQDERLSTVEATHYLLEADLSRKKRKTKVDAVAANIILQTYLDKMKG